MGLQKYSNKITFWFHLKLLPMLQDIIETVNPRFYTELNQYGQLRKQTDCSIVSWSLHPVELEFPVTSRYKGTCCACRPRNWSFETGKHTLQVCRETRNMTVVATRQPATSGLGLLLLYSLAHFVQLTCWPLVPTSSTDVIYVLEVKVFVPLPLF